MSYREVARRGRALQAGLDELGIGEGERVAIVSHNAGRLLELLLSVPSSGRVAVPINFRLSPEEVRYIVGHSGARVLLVDPELESSLKGIEAEHRFGTGRSTSSSCCASTPSPAPGPSPTRTPPPRSTTPAGRRRGRRACR
ncbi:AMP-binding protein [Blastococcus brunescens]|uniref:AMP-binding protein n=1 Tax=Blastococcus brunescens TaxID=1564165 RepID=A0ABZ1AWW1_9ACTN|nr:AMP-binding protein [Blastococcus sp. BMG 8361]WRL61868.1 AMP-binding protein [Blastococcus sp. BMG 8361]